VNQVNGKRLVEDISPYRGIVDISSPVQTRLRIDFVHALVDKDGLSETHMGGSVLNSGREDEHSQEIRGSI
jgi:hypothetical protein